MGRNFIVSQVLNTCSAAENLAIPAVVLSDQTGRLTSLHKLTLSGSPAPATAGPGFGVVKKPTNGRRATADTAALIAILRIPSDDRLPRLLCYGGLVFAVAVLALRRMGPRSVLPVYLPPAYVQVSRNKAQASFQPNMHTATLNSCTLWTAEINTSSSRTTSSDRARSLQ